MNRRLLVAALAVSALAGCATLPKARLCEAEFARLFPVTHAAFCEFGRVAP